MARVLVVVRMRGVVFRAAKRPDTSSDALTATAAEGHYVSVTAGRMHREHGVVAAREDPVDVPFRGVACQMVKWRAVCQVVVVGRARSAGLEHVNRIGKVQKEIRQAERDDVQRLQHRVADVRELRAAFC